MTEVSPELIAEIDSAEPDYVIPVDPHSAYGWYEITHTAIEMLGLHEMHARVCPHHASSDIATLDSLEARQLLAGESEALLGALKGWLCEHGVAELTFWYPSAMHGGAFVRATLEGTGA